LYVPFKGIEMTGEALRWTASTSVIVIMLVFAGIQPTMAQTKDFNVPAQSATTGIPEFARQAGIQILVSEPLVRGKRVSAVMGSHSIDEALAILLKGTGLTATSKDGATYTVAVAQASPITHDSAAPLGASAQNLPAGESAPVPHDNGMARLEEVVVTAQKREERLIDVPSSVIALSSETLQGRHLVSLEDYVASVPGLTLNDIGGGYQQLQIRGIGTGSYGNPTVSTYVDNAPVGSSTTAYLVPNLDPNDIQQVEVLRGPQGTLYGADNLGGLINYDTVAPNLRDLEGRVWLDGLDMTNGRFGYATRGRVSVPLVVNRLAMLVSAFSREEPGFISDAALGLKNINSVSGKGGRAALLWSITDNLLVKLSAMSYERQVGGETQEDVDPVTLRPVYGDLQQRRSAGTGGVSSTFRLYTANVDWNSDWGHVTSTTSYNTTAFVNAADFTGFFQPRFAPVFGSGIGYAVSDIIPQSNLSEEVRLGFHTGSYLDWRVGGFYTRQRVNTFESTASLNPTTGVPIAVPILIESALTPQKFDEEAAFGEGTLHITPRLDLSGGVRYARHDQTQDTVFSGLLLGLPNTTATTHESSSDHATTFQVSPRLKLDDNLMLYGRIASGYRPGGPNAVGFPSYQPDRDTNYEAGIKGEFPQQRVSLDLALFYVDWVNIQFDTVNPLGLHYLGNASSASSKGVESTINYVPISSLTLSGQLAYIDAKLDSQIPTGSYSYGAKGDRLPFSPLWKGALYVDYQFRPLGGWTPFVGASYLFNGQEFGNFTSTAAAPRVSLPSYQTVDARIGTRSDRWTVQAFAKNIGNKRGFDGESTISGGPRSPVAVTVIQPRIIGLSVIARF
jgi:iron complex outermembrane receptor protein